MRLFFGAFLLTAAGAGGGQARRAGQGRGHAAPRGTASPHTVPTAATPRYAGRQQSGALGTLQEHSAYTYIINLIVPPGSHAAARVEIPEGIVRYRGIKVK